MALGRRFAGTVWHHGRPLRLGSRARRSRKSGSHAGLMIRPEEEWALDSPATRVRYRARACCARTGSERQGIGALDSEGRAVPTAAELAREVSKEFLGGDHSDSPLSIVAELASHNDLTRVQELVAKRFSGLQPAAFIACSPGFAGAGCDH